MPGRISVLTPCYDHEPFLDRYFDSLLTQSYDNVEIVFVDDASRDGSWDKAISFQAQLEARGYAVAFRRHGENQGLLRTLSECVDLATGEYLAFLESDDWYYPERLALAVATLESDAEVGAVHGEVDVFHEREGKLEERWWGAKGRVIEQGDVLEALLHENHILSCAFTCRADLLRSSADFDRYVAAGYQTADYAIFLDLARVSRFAYLDRALAVYRVREGSISHPADEVRRLQWKLDYYRIKDDFLARTDAGSGLTRRRARRQLISTRAQVAWLHRDRASYAGSLEELVACRLATRRERIAATLARSRAGWLLLSLLKATPGLTSASTP